MSIAMGVNAPGVGKVADLTIESPSERNPATAELGVGDDISNAFGTTLSRVQRLTNP
jgi:hypothetical protein